MLSVCCLCCFCPVPVYCAPCRYNADVFGRVYDVNGEAAIDDVSGFGVGCLEGLAQVFIATHPGCNNHKAFQLQSPTSPLGMCCHI